ncbi:MAG: capsule biosynthesis protein, partial [Chitinophagaceae bacterium]|nr:capsule biosynthesis protein [Chitinophagaceae bacterium]
MRTTDGARAPDTYILGAGDRIRITIFGMSQADLLLEINKEGYIQPTGLKQLYLQGVTLGEARKLVGQRFSAAYRFQQDQFTLTLQTARAITVNVFGETNLRGSFNISALNTAFNALAVAGGPTSQGSVRSIELIRGKTRKKMDVYSFLRDPAFQFQFDIQQNDI